MVAKIGSGTSMRGVLYYNENKVRNAEAKLLLASGFGVEAAHLSFRSKLERFAKLTTQNDRAKKNAIHISLNFSPQDRLDEDTLKLITLEYMDRIGFGGQPFLLYQHFDAAHLHVHIATTNIAEGGQRIETYNIGKNFSEPARKVIEQTYGLVRAEDQKNEEHFQLRPVNLEKALYGKAATKAAISAIVRAVVDTYKFGSLPELNAVLGQFNVMADRGQEGSRMFEKKGLHYRLLDGLRNKIGVPIKASSIYSSPTLSSLERLFGSNETARKPYGERLKYLLDKTLSTAKTEEDLIQLLREKGVQILFRQNAEGRIYGVTYIDNATCCVFNGNDLGKSYAAKRLLERLPGAVKPLAPTTNSVSREIPHPEQTAELPKAYNSPGAAGVIEVLIDILTEPMPEYDNPYPLRRKKKKKQMDL